MHMADALVSPAVATTMYLASGAMTIYSIKKLEEENDPQKLPMMGVMGAFVFAAQMINFTIPGTGSSGHLTGGLMLTALLGPYAGFLTMIGILAVQCLLFADGGLLALGCNIWNMAFYGCFIASMLIFKPIIQKHLSKKRLMIASILGSIISLQLGAFSVVAETELSGITALPWNLFLGVMQPIHLAIGAVEGIITGLVLSFIYEARPELIWQGHTNKKPKTSKKSLLAIFGAAAVIIAGVLSLFASAFPDGLEWSILKLTGSTELHSKGGVYALSSHIQKLTALLPDYMIPGQSSVVGGMIAGIIGVIVVIALYMLIHYYHEKHSDSNQQSASN